MKLKLNKSVCFISLLSRVIFGKSLYHERLITRQMLSASWGEPEICMDIAMVTVKWRQMLQCNDSTYLQLLVDKQACVVTVVFVSR